MDTNEKIDYIYEATIKMKERLENVCDTVDKHNNEIYGNSKNGLKTSMTLVEDNLDGLGKAYRSLKLSMKEAIEKLNKLSREISFNLGKMAGMSFVISIVIALISIGVFQVIK